eukprot:Nk52_evm1s2227 gene=Nk52_evmTU1s2227
MDSESFNLTLSYLASSGIVLSEEESSAMETSLTLLKAENKFKKVLFLGKIMGVNKDYFIAQGFEDNSLDRKNFVSHDGLNWVQLPVATDVEKKWAISILHRFTGTASNEFKVNLPNVDESEGPAMSEEKRVAAVVALLDEHIAIVPRGAYLKNPTGDIIKNRNFGGLSKEDSVKESSYMHFCHAAKLEKKSLLEKMHLDKSVDFLDPISEDSVKNTWSIQTEDGCNIVVIRSLMWPGAAFFHMPGTDRYGYSYCGYGEYNTSLGFML